MHGSFVLLKACIKKHDDDVFFSDKLVDGQKSARTRSCTRMQTYTRVTHTSQN